MNTSMKTLVASSVAAFVLVGTAVPASAAEPAMPDQQMMMQGQAQGSGAPGAMPGYGMGMMGGGMGPGMGMMGGMMNMMGGGCPMMGGGMGPGMGMMGGGMGPMAMMGGGMGGYGPGAGMMMGPGMMGGMGSGYGMGPGMGGGMGPMAMLNLSEAQTAQLKKVQTESMKKQRALMLQMWEAQANLGDLVNAEKRDPAAIGKAYDKLADVQRQALEAHIDAENKAAAVLTKEQKAQMRCGFGRGMMGC
jgi:Spy/CpxP family protein refolding chaperone